MKRLKKSAMWVFMLIYLIVVFGFVENRYEDQLCNKLEVSIEDSLNMGFLRSEDIVRILNKKGIEYLGIPLDELDLGAIETAVYENQIISTCKVYTGINGTLRVEVEQRHPFVRIIEKNGKGFYLDREGNVLGLSSRFAPHVLVVNGNLRSSFRVGEPANVTKLPESVNNNRLKEVFELSSFIAGNEFWSAQIVQVYVNSNGEFELIPRVGPHIIILGPLDDYTEKFGKLELFYKEGLNHAGWNQYLKINLKYKDQIVCTKI